MIIKYCFKDEIHKSFTPPVSYHELIQEVNNIFLDNLPPKFSLQYRDNDGDFITISSDLEYTSMLRYDLPKSKTSIKIYIVPTHQPFKETPKTQRSTKAKSSNESFEVIEGRNGNVIESSVNEASLHSDESRSESSEISKKIRIGMSDEYIDFSEEDTPPIDLDCSVNYHNTTLNMIEARVLALKSHRHKAHDLEDDYDSCDEQGQVDYGLERILTDIKPPNPKTNSRPFSPPQDYSLESSILSKEIDETTKGLDNLRFINIIKRLQSLRVLNSEMRLEDDSISDDSVELKNIRPIIFDSMEFVSKSGLQEKNEAARKIQSSFRNFKIRKLIRIIQRTEASPQFNDESRKKPTISSPFSREECYLCDEFEYCEHLDENKTFQDSHLRKSYSEIESPVQKIPSFPNKQDDGSELMSANNSYRYQLHSPKESNFISLGSEKTRKTVFKTIYLMNVGDKEWKKIYIKSVGPLGGQTYELFNVDVGQLVLVPLQLNGNFGAGHYSTQWRIIHENEYGMTEVVGEPFNLEFTIITKDDIFPDVKRNPETENDQSVEEKEIYQEIGKEDNSFEEKEENENETDFQSEEEEEKIDEETTEDQENELVFAKFGDCLEEVAKVRRLSLLFPSDPWDEIFDFVAARPEASVNDLLMAYLDYRNEFAN